jgi:hypothetical protein
LASDSRFVIATKSYVKFQQFLLDSIRIHCFAPSNSGVSLRLQGITK